MKLVIIDKEQRLQLVLELLLRIGHIFVIELLSEQPRSLVVSNGVVIGFVEEGHNVVN